MTKLAFIDTETTGLDPDYHDIWDVGLIVRDEDGIETHRQWFLRDVSIGRADAYALNIGRFHERYPASPIDTTDNAMFAKEFAKWTWGAHLVGNVVSFDEERLRRLLRRHGQCPGWHYHIIDVEALAVGYLRRELEALNERTGGGARSRELLEVSTPPYRSVDLSRALGVEPPGDEEKHTALADARWARDIYDRILA